MSNSDTRTVLEVNSIYNTEFLIYYYGPDYHNESLRNFNKLPIGHSNTAKHIDGLFYVKKKCKDYGNNNYDNSYFNVYLIYSFNENKEYYLFLNTQDKKNKKQFNKIC